MTAGDDLPRETFPPADPASFVPPGSGGIAAAGPAPELAEAGPPDRSFVEDLRDLAADAQTALAAEKAYQSARAGYVLGRGKAVVVQFAVAAGLVYFALIAAIVGLLLALAPLLTAWGALAAVTLTLVIAAFILFRMAMKRVRRMRTVLSLRADNDEAPS